MSKSPYDRKWRKRRARQLEEFPLCKLCMDVRGLTVPATVADHVERHGGDPIKFKGPLQSLCAPCHNGVKQSLESGGDGYIRGCDLRGNPLDPRHPWNTPRGVS